MPQGRRDYRFRRPGAGDPQWLRLQRGRAGGVIGSLPTVLTVGVNALSSTSANLIGSVNPNGRADPWNLPTNLTPNPSFEYDPVGNVPVAWVPSINFNNVGTALTCQTASGSQTGSRAMRIVSDGALASEGAEVALAGMFFAGQRYTLSFYAKGNSGGEKVYAILGISTDLAESAGTTLTTDWQRVSITWTPASNRTGVSACIQFGQTPAAAVYVDGVQASQTAIVINYTDGDQPGYAWAGTPGNSPTQQVGTWWWFSYGTSLPLPSGTTSPVSFAGSGTAATTFTYSPTDLTPGQTYYAAMVAQNYAGTVYGQTLSFVAQAVSPAAAQPVVPYGQSAVTIPHFDVPFTLVTSGTASGARVVEQDTNEDVLACVRAIVDCPIRACPQLPSFGIQEPTFAQEPVSSGEITAAIQRLEPRATTNVVSQLLPDGVSWGVTLDVSTTSSGQLT